MITRIAIENYRCFEQVVIEPGSLALLMGPNGAGKSTVFDALWNIRQLVIAGESAPKLFPSSSPTRWGRVARQRFELGLRGPEGDYTYRLDIRQGKWAQEAQIEREEILREEQPVYSFAGEEVEIRRQVGANPKRYPAGNKLSPLANLPANLRSGHVAWVRERLSRIWVFRPVPPTLHPLTDRQGDFLEPDLSNFAAWLYRVQKAHPSLKRHLKQSLQNALDGFDDYQFPRLGRKTNVLMFHFASPRRRTTSVLYTLDELSEGQRALVVLYALLHAIAGKSTTLCIDEPEGFLSPREIQPWLNQLMDRTEDGGQALLISHSAGMIDLLGPSNGILFDRPRGGPVRVQSVPRDETGLPLSKLLARGWLE